MKPHVFNYTNYRDYLSDYVQTSKADKTSFSFRNFSLRAEISSPSHLLMVIQGKRNLTLESIDKFIKGLGLKGKEKDFFKSLVLFNQEKDPVKKVSHLEQIKKIRFSTNSKSLKFSEQSSLYDPWYLPILYESVILDNFVEDPKLIAEKLGRKLSEKQVRDGLEKLKSEGWITAASRSGRWAQKTLAVSAANEQESALIQAFHKHMGEWALNGLSVPVEKREYGAVTVALSEEKLVMLKTMIKKFIEDANFEGSQSVLKENLYQLNIQLFPLT